MTTNRMIRIFIKKVCYHLIKSKRKCILDNIWDTYISSLKPISNIHEKELINNLFCIQIIRDMNLDPKKLSISIILNDISNAIFISHNFYSYIAIHGINPNNLKDNHLTYNSPFGNFINKKRTKRDFSHRIDYKKLRFDFEYFFNTGKQI